jgi:hypothetical protein
MLFDEIYAEITKDKTEVFFKLYADEYGPGVLISIPDNFDDFFLCALGQHLTVSKVKYRKFNNLYVQGNLEVLKRLQRVFKFEIYEDYKKNRIDFSESDLICDNVLKHSPVSQFGMLCMSRYYAYFDKNDEPRTSLLKKPKEHLDLDIFPETSCESDEAADKEGACS